MITIYKNKKDIPPDLEYIELNDIFFNRYTAMRLDERAKPIIKQIDHAGLVSKYKITSGFNGALLDIDQLSSGCKTVLNVLYFPDKVFCLKECGNNALEIVFTFKRGSIYSEYAMIPFDMNPVMVYSNAQSRVIDDYEELKEWWSYEE